MSERLGEEMLALAKDRKPGGCATPSMSDGPVQSELLPHARLSFSIVQYGCRRNRQELTAAILIIAGGSILTRGACWHIDTRRRFLNLGVRSSQVQSKLIVMQTCLRPCQLRDQGEAEGRRSPGLKESPFRSPDLVTS